MFLQQRLPHERQASQNTSDSYAYAFLLLFAFASKQYKVSPSALLLEQIDAPLVMAFLEHLEKERNNSPRTRNARLAAVKSFMRFIEYRVPSALDQVRRIMAIPVKKTDVPLVNYLTQSEIQALLDAPDENTLDGIRDRAMLHVAYAGGLRVSELVGLRMEDLSFEPRLIIRVRGKGRKERALPLWKETGRALRAWLAIREKAAVPEVFLNSRGQHITRSGFSYILKKYVMTAIQRSPCLAKKRVSPHVLRHTCAMIMLQATHDIRKVSIWLGHATLQSTEVYVQADPNEKLEAIEAITPPLFRKGRFQPPDRLIALFRNGGTLCSVR